MAAGSPNSIFFNPQFSRTSFFSLKKVLPLGDLFRFLDKGFGKRKAPGINVVTETPERRQLDAAFEETTSPVQCYGPLSVPVPWRAHAEDSLLEKVSLVVFQRLI